MVSKSILQGISKKKINVFFILIIVLSIFMRFYHLDQRPLHFDEGNHWESFANKIYKGQDIQYLPDFHGFTSFYLSTISLYFLGVSVFSLRFMVALTGVLLVVLFFAIRKEIGNFGTLIASLFLTISPSFVYYTRMFNQYPYILLFSICSLVAIVYYLKKDRSIYLYLFALFIGLLISTHEISLIFLFIMASFVLVLYYFNLGDTKFLQKTIKRYRTLNIKNIIIMVIIIVLTIAIIMSSFFTNFNNLHGFITQKSFLLDKSFNTGHNKPVFYYILTFLPLEIFAFLGLFLSLFIFKRTYFSLFILYWTVISLCIFSMIPYKIPLMFNIVLLPMYILSGLTVDKIYNLTKNKKLVRIIFYAALLIIFIYMLSTSIKITYIHPTDKAVTNPLNYVGPVDDNYRLFNDMYSYLGSYSYSTGELPKILITDPGFWPLNYYLKDYRVEYLTIQNVDIYPYYDKYEMFIVSTNTTYHKQSLTELGTYELRENYFIKVLVKK